VGSDAGAMRKLPLLLVLLLLSVLLAAATAQASLLPGALEPAPGFLAEPEEESEAEEDEDDEEAEDAAEEAEIEREICEEDPELCEEESGNGNGKGNPCLLRNAKASLIANPGKRRLRLSVHYRTSKPATVSVVTSLQGPKGAVRLGTEHARFRRSGVYRETYALAEKQMKKALAANQFTVVLHVVNTPPSCSIELTKASRRAKR
jgi:hypothetical protein